MKKCAIMCAALAMLAVAVVAQASVQTILFNGSDIVADAPAAPNLGTPAVGDGYISTSSATIRTYGVSGDPAAFNAWLGSLGNGQGISGFNLWLQDGLSNQAGLWGETIALADPKISAANIVPFASSGWTASVYTVGTKWGDTWIGSKLISYTANSAADYLRPGTQASFGFTADVIGFDGGSSPYQMWVGAGNAASSDTDVNQLAGVAGGVYFQRAITAEATPEPTTVIIWSLFGVLCITVGYWRRKRVA
jgi:hypothetical protein